MESSRPRGPIVPCQMLPICQMLVATLPIKPTQIGGVGVPNVVSWPESLWPAPPAGEVSAQVTSIKPVEELYNFGEFANSAQVLGTFSNFSNGCSC